MKTSIITYLVLWVLFFMFSLPVASQDKSMSVFVSSNTRSGGTAFFQGMPITISIFLSNNEIRRAHEEAIEKWRGLEQGSISTDSLYQALQHDMYISQDMLLKIAETGERFLSDLDFQMSRTDQDSDEPCTKFPWKEKIISRSFANDQPLILGKMPFWVTFEFSPDMTIKMTPGEYALRAFYPGAEPGTCSISLAPAISESQKAALYYEQAEYYLRNEKDYQKSIDLARMAEGSLPERHDMIYLTLGNAYMGLGDLENAVTAYERFLKTYEGASGWNYPSLVRGKVNQLKSLISAKKEEQQ